MSDTDRQCKDMRVGPMNLGWGTKLKSTLRKHECEKYPPVGVSGMKLCEIVLFLYHAKDALSKFPTNCVMFNRW